MTDLRKKLPCTVNVLGTPYRVEFRTNEDERMTGCGYCSYREHLIAIKPAHGKDGFTPEMSNHLEHEELRHEIVHAFLEESGLGYDSLSVVQWAKNEEMVDWFAIQSPKIFATYKELGIL